MDFTSAQDYVDALKELESFPLMGLGIEENRLVFHSLSSRVALPLNRWRGYGYGIVDYGLNKLDVDVHHVNYHDHFKQVRLFDEEGLAVRGTLREEPAQLDERQPVQEVCAPRQRRGVHGGGRRLDGCLRELVGDGLAGVLRYRSRGRSVYRDRRGQRRRAVLQGGEE